MALALYVAWPAEDRSGRGLRRAFDHALTAIPDLADRRLISVLLDAAGAPPPDAVQALLENAADRLDLAPDLEATLAIDPRATTPQSLADHRAAGINRLALRAGVLDESAQGLLAAAGALFPRCAIDLTFGRPGQTLAGWRAELDRALAAGAGHISLEEDPSAEARNADRVAELYRTAIDHLRAAGLPPYEIAHCARPGQESRQLLHGAAGGDYLGIGPGGIGRITVGRTCYALSQVEPAGVWLHAVETATETTRQPLSPGERATELLLSGLRLRDGVGRAWFERLAGPLETALDAGQLSLLIEDGFVVLDRAGLRLTDRGWPLCDGVLARLLK